MHIRFMVRSDSTHRISRCTCHIIDRSCQIMFIKWSDCANEVLTWVQSVAPDGNGDFFIPSNRSP